MDKLRVGIIVEENAIATEGGGYTYYRTLLNSINNYSFRPELEIVNIVFSTRSKERLGGNKRAIVVRNKFLPAVVYTMFDIIYRVWYRTVRAYLPSIGDTIMDLMDSVSNNSLLSVLIKEKIDLVYYLKPVNNVINYPVIITHWDVGHKSMYAFPEVALDGNLKKREKYYLKTLSKAFLILCESKAGVDELLNYYPINPDKVKMIPIFSGDVVNQQVSAAQQQETLLQYDLTKNRFFVYPAQFWAHKNHYNLILAFRELLKEPGCTELKLVLCGTDKGNLTYIRKLVYSLDLMDKVLFPGFVTHPVLFTLYKNAVALVMPTFLGPTNIPLIEAAQLGCPVLCTDLTGHIEILGDAAMYFDPANVTSIKTCMLKILEEDYRNELIKAAHDWIENSCFNVDKSVSLLQKVLLQLKPVRKAWGTTG